MFEWVGGGRWSGDGEGKLVVESASCSMAWRGSRWQWLQIEVLDSVDRCSTAWLEARQRHGSIGAVFAVESDRERFEFRVI